MLSVQAPGCAGMERLGAPPPPPPAPGGRHHRHHHVHVHSHHHALGCGQQLEQVVGRLLEQQARARSAAAAEMLGLPPSLALPDGEHGRDAHLQIRVPYQQAELTRSSVQPPPNKSVSDVPEWACAGAAAAAAAAATGGGVEAAATGGQRRAPPGKKDGFVQKAVRYLYRMSARPPPPAILQQLGANDVRLQRDAARRSPAVAASAAPAPAPPAPPPPAPAPCVMVPLRPPAARTHPPPPPPDA